MKNKTYIVIDPLGIHARPAGLIVKLFKEFKSSIKVESNNKTVDGKSVLGIMSLGVKTNGEMTVIVDGEDENNVFDKLEKLSNEQNPTLLKQK